MLNITYFNNIMTKIQNGLQSEAITNTHWWFKESFKYSVIIIFLIVLCSLMLIVALMHLLRQEVPPSILLQEFT